MSWKDNIKKNPGTDKIHCFFCVFFPLQTSAKIGTLLGVWYREARGISFESREINTSFCILKGPLNGGR